MTKTSAAALAERAFQNDFRTGQSDMRPWGDWTVLDAGPGFAVKRVRVAPGGSLSLQRHQYRAEQWTIIAGIGRVTRNAESFDLMAGESIGFAVGDIHRMANPGTEDLIFIEVETGHALLEDDLERLDDIYGRAN